ncbi:MAG TPA: hypothetical protein VFW03_18980 [Gemmatimonadaceae bacterium]|nr:hypothetical protein [Gemmatimonadaceae bacterium]
MIVASFLGDTAMLRTAANRVATERNEIVKLFGRSFELGLATRSAGSTPTAAQATEALRNFAAAMRSLPGARWVVDNYAFPFAPSAVVDSSLATVLRDGSLAGFETPVTSARGHIAIARGDFATGIAMLASIDTSRAPMPVRLGAVRAAALGSWLGGVSVGAADANLARARSLLGNAMDLNATELQWLDGVIGIAAGDSVRVFRAAAAITDSTLVGRRFAPSLRALWRERQTGNVDSLIASEDSAITKGGDFTTITALHRLAIGRALTRAGDPSRAEHYLQWTDAWFTDARSSALAFMMAPYTSYQRALAFEAAGDRARAKLHFERFIDRVDRPPPSIKPQVDDAKSRLARLSGDARR